MKKFFKPFFMILAAFAGKDAHSQAAAPFPWKPGMQVKMYSTGSRPGADTVIIGTESYFHSDRSGKAKKTKLNISQNDLNDLLEIFKRYDLTGIQSNMTMMNVKDGWTRSLAFTDGEKTFHLSTGSTFEIKDPVQKKNADAIYAYLNALVSKAKK